MNWLRKSLVRAGILSSNRHKSGDKNEQQDQSVNVPYDREVTGLNDPLKEYMAKMLNLIRELIIFCLLMMAISALTNDPPKVSKAAAATPFLSKNALVKDFYKGELSAAIDYARNFEFSFIMFYAPWDAQSQAARKEFLAAANYMKDYVVFTAVNCWQPQSECRNQYNKVYRWPVLIVYPCFGPGIKYNGPISAPHMISFLYKLMKPLKKISDTNLNFEEAFVVAELNALPKSREFSVYYTIALKYLESDYEGRITFYVKPVKVSQNKLSLYLWNQVRVLDIEPGDWKVAPILNWIIKSSESPSSWLAPSGSKSSLLSDVLQPGPSLILFTAKNPLHSANDYYMMLQEVAHEYKNCDDWGLNYDMATKRSRNLLEYQKLKRMCQVKSTPAKLNDVWSLSISAPFVNSSSNKLTIGNKQVDCNSINLGVREPFTCQGLIAEKFPDVPIKSGKFKNALRESELYPTSMWRQDSDPKSMQNLRKLLRRDKCRTFLLAEELTKAIFVESNIENTDQIDISTLGCDKVNGSLNFIALDSLRYYMFAERLGIDLSTKSDSSAVVILDESLETHYIMQGRINSTNLRRFVQRFSNNTLTRSMKSSVNVVHNYTPSYRIRTEDNADTFTVYVEEIDSTNFLDTIQQQNKATVLMYYSKQCSYCNGISYVFLTLARKLSFVDNLQFARIDGDINILPWEYTMEEFPTILFIPTNRKEESRVYPSNIPITVPHLLGFILSNVDVSSKLHVMYSVCLHSQLEKDKNICMATIRNETLSLIDKTLTYWRKSNNRHRQLLLHNLKQLRQLHFLFNHSPDDYKLIESYFKKLQVYEKGHNTTSSLYLVKDEL
ncbi:thioredoxin domain-containing protein 11 isoform X2 [Dendroctonus ponderosae]|uniref:Thioredoxin domain-containing protein n=1 Tax=Dendroctonus ponderosae TaxID=77166 RepID=A0AAR5PSU4_DENPD|nr:thioredoxin domain-containing protein 11 isoform X2 [Dendroctonus ponderosae]